MKAHELIELIEQVANSGDDVQVLCEETAEYTSEFELVKRFGVWMLVSVLEQDK